MFYQNEPKYPLCNCDVLFHELKKIYNVKISVKIKKALALSLIHIWSGLSSIPFSFHLEDIKNKALAALNIGIEIISTTINNLRYVNGTVVLAETLEVANQ